MFQHQIEPLFDNGRTGIPVKRVLPDNDIVFQQELLFFLHIDIEIGISFVQVVESDALKVLRMRHQAALHPRLFQHGMCEEDEYSGHVHKVRRMKKEAERKQGSGEEFSAMATASGLPTSINLEPV